MNFSKLEALKEAYRVASSPVIRVGTLDPPWLDPLCSRPIHASLTLICQLCLHLHKTPVFIRPNLTEGFGHCNNETKVCDGMLGLLQRGEIDIVANIYLYISALSPILQYTSYIQEIQPHFIYGPEIGSKMSKTSDDNMNLGMAKNCYAFIFSIFGLVFIISYVRIRVMNHHNIHSWFDIFWHTFEGFLGQDFRGKLIFFSFFPIVIITQTAFKGQALSPTYPKLPFADSKELAHLIKTGKYQVILPSKDVEKIWVARTPALIGHPPRYDFTNSIKIRQEVCASKNVISLSYMERYMGPMCNFYSQPDPKYLGSDKYYFGALVSRYVPKWFFERVQRVTLRVFSPDVYRYWILSKYVPFSYTNEVNADESVQQDEQLKLKAWMKCICCVLAGYIACIVVLWIEIYWHSRMQRLHDARRQRSQASLQYKPLSNVRDELYMSAPIKTNHRFQYKKLTNDNWFMKH